MVPVPFGRWVCYYLVDHPEKGRCHYFQIQPDAADKLPTKAEMEYLLKEFGIERPLLDEHITMDETAGEIRLFFPQVKE